MQVDRGTSCSTSSTDALIPHQHGYQGAAMVNDDPNLDSDGDGAYDGAWWVVSVPAGTASL